MSWSIDLSGRPDDVCEKLEGYAPTLKDPMTAAQYADALPHLIGLVRQTRTTASGVVNGYPALLVHVVASGSGSAGKDVEGELCRQCQVQITVTSLTH